MGKKKKTVAQLTAELAQVKGKMIEALNTVGETGTQREGLGALVSKVKNATVLNDDGAAIVSSAGAVKREDLVALTRELVREAEPLRAVSAADGDIRLLEVCKVPDSDAVAMMFFQGRYVIGTGYVGQIKLKAARWTAGGWELGPTTSVAEVETVQAPRIRSVALVGFQAEGHTGVAVFYRVDDEPQQMWMTELTGLSFGSMADAGIQWNAFISADTDIKNLSAAWMLAPDYTQDPVTYESCLVVGFLTNGVRIALVDLAWNDSDAVFEAILEKSTTPGRITTHTVRTGSMTGSPTPGTVAGADTDEYTAPGAWCVLANGKGEALLVYPNNKGGRQALLFVTHKRFNGASTEDYRLELFSGRALAYADYVPAGAGLWDLESDSREPGANGPYLLGGFSRTSTVTAGGATSTVQRSSLTFESWSGGYFSNLLPMWYAQTPPEYKSAIGMFSLCRAGRDKLAAGFYAENEYRTMMFYRRPDHDDDLIGGPVTAAPGSSVTRMVESGAGVATVYQGSDGIYLCHLREMEVAQTVYSSDEADAKAVTSGRPGQEIQIKWLGE